MNASRINPEPLPNRSGPRVRARKGREGNKEGKGASAQPSIISSPSVPRVADSPEPVASSDAMMTAARQIPDADPIAHLDFTPEILCEAPHCVGDPSNPGDYLVEWTKPVIAHLTGVARWVLCRPCWDRGALDVAQRDAPWMLRIVKVIR